MSLTAARTELNIILAGADETARMLAESRENMRRLEERLRALTAATNAQAGAAGGAGAATAGFSDRAAAAAGAIDAQRERIDGAITKAKEYIGLWGDIGDIISGAVDAYNWIKEKVSETAAEEANHKKILEEQKAIYEKIRESLEEIKKVKQESVVETRSMNQQLLTEQIRLAELQKNDDLAASLRAKLEHQTELDRVTELNEQLDELSQSKIANEEIISEARQRIRDNEAFRERNKAEADQLEMENAAKKLQLEQLMADVSESSAVQAWSISSDIKDNEAQIERLKQQIYEVTTNTIKPEQARLDAAMKTNIQYIKQRSVLDGLLGVAIQIAEAFKGGGDALNMDVLDESGAATKPRGGGGGARPKSEEELEQEARERKERNRKLGFEMLQDDLALEAAKKRAMVDAAKGDDIVAAQRLMKQRILDELATLPTDATAKAFDPLRKELEKQLGEIDKVMKDHAPDLGYWSQADNFDPEIVTKILDQWDKEAEGIAKVDNALNALTETRQAAAAEAEKMADALERSSIADVITSTTAALEGLSEIQAPALEAISESVAGLTTQFGKFKEGQTSLASAIVGSAGAIAGAVANKVLGVREEAGVRALFESAMGIATAFSNPLESAGHFAAAAAFGAVALGGFKSTPSGGSGGGSKAPAKTDAKSRDSMMGGGGGQVTNVYNLQTGIVDGQSTAQAFRRAEMQARNTGMASAGGW